STSGLTGHRAWHNSRSASGRSPCSGADGGPRDGGAPGRGLWHLRSRRSPGRAARAAARDTAPDTQPCGAPRHGCRH
uniref:RIKEN cDNA E130116L18 gene n=1 Tax=Cricetulus griseus TaxID=10029 RepID=A0A8C2MDZ4_CRIGR